MDNQSNFHGSKQRISKDQNGKEDTTNDSRNLTLSSESTATDALSPDVLTSPLAHDEGYPLVEFSHWGQRPRSGGGSTRSGDDGVECDNNDIKRGSSENGIYQQNKTRDNGSQVQLLPNQTVENENGYELNKQGHKRAWTEKEEKGEELPLTSAIRLGQNESMEDVPYPLPMSGFLPDITLNGNKNNSSRNLQCDSNDPISVNDTEFNDNDDDDDDTQSIQSYDEEQIEAYDRRKSREASQKTIPELSNNADVEASQNRNFRSIFSNPSRMLKIPSISAIVSSKKKKQVDAQICESDNENIDDKKVFPPLLSSTTPMNDEPSDKLPIDLHHPFMSSGLDNGDNYWCDDEGIRFPKAPQYTQIEMIRLADIYLFIHKSKTNIYEIQENRY